MHAVLGDPFRRCADQLVVALNAAVLRITEAQPTFHGKVRVIGSGARAPISRVRSTLWRTALRACCVCTSCSTATPSCSLRWTRWPRSGRPLRCSWRPRRKQARHHLPRACIDRRAGQGVVRPRCSQVLNICLSSDPFSYRVEPLLSRWLGLVQPAVVVHHTPRRMPGSVAAVDRRRGVSGQFGPLFAEGDAGARRRPVVAGASSSKRCISVMRACQEAAAAIADAWWGDRRIDYEVQAPHGAWLQSSAVLMSAQHRRCRSAPRRWSSPRPGWRLRSATRPHCGSYFENLGVSALLAHVMLHEREQGEVAEPVDDGAPPFVFGAAKEKWQHKRNIKVRAWDRSIPRRIADSRSVAEPPCLRRDCEAGRSAGEGWHASALLFDAPQIVAARFLYGMLDMALSLETISVFATCSGSPAPGKWTLLGTAATDKHGRVLIMLNALADWRRRKLELEIPAAQALSVGTHQIKACADRADSWADA